MKALVCDDDASTRFMVRRLLEENFGCEVAECGDGVEGLRMLARERFAFIMLDLEMPSMSGVETLEEIRACSATRELPVIILSRERDEETVVKLLRLGISEYLLKPLRSHLAVGKIEKIIQMIPRTVMEATDLERIRLSAETPAIIVDGNLDYRYFFNDQLQRYGRIAQSDSGAAALSLCRKTSFPLVFIGDDLGVVSPQRLAQKLRELNPNGGVRLVRVVDKPLPPTEAKVFDAVVRRSYVPDTFRALLRPFIFIPGPYTALMEMVPELPGITSSAATQVFGMMFDAEIVPSTEASPTESSFASVLDIELEDRFAIKLGIHLSKPAARAAASKMAGGDPSEFQDEDCLSVAGELGNILTGRVHARFQERNLKSVCSLPVLSQGAAFTAPEEATGLVQRFLMPEVGEFFLSLSVADRLEESRQKVAAEAAAKAAAAQQAEDERLLEPTPASASA